MQARLRFAIDRERRAFIVGVPRDLLHLKADLLRMVVAVASLLDRRLLARPFLPLQAGL